MAKKDQVEIVEEPVVESSLAAPESPLDFLLGNIINTEVEQTKLSKLPLLKLYMPGKKYSDKGATTGWVIDKGDGSTPEVNITSLRLARVDAPVMQRLMWPYGADGKRLQQVDPLPACASSDGISPRKADAFGYIGKQFVDWRNGNKVTILENGCGNCPLGQWAEVFVDGQPVIEKNSKGIAYTKRAAPPCSEMPAYVFYDFDRKCLLLYQTGNFTSTVFIMGSNGRYNKRFKGVIKGVEEFYYTDKGSRRPDVSPEPGVLYALNFTAQFVDNSPYGMTPAPKVKLDEYPLSAEEITEYATKVQEYNADNVRGFISGEMWAVQENMTPATEEVDASQPF